MNGYDRYLQQLETKESRGDKLSFSSSKKSSAAKSAAKAHAQAISKLNKEYRPRKKRRVPVLSIVLSLLGLVSAYWGYENHEKLEKMIDSVEVSFMTKSTASEAQTPAKAQSEAATTAGKDDKKTEEAVQEKVNNEEVVDFNYIKDFQERKKQLDMREEELKKLEAEMMVQKESVDKKLEEVENIRKQISQQLEERVKADEQKIDTLVQVYSQMKPQQAAKVFETIDEDLAVEVLTKMKKKSAADILNLLKADRAQSLSEKYAGYKRKPAATANSMATSAAPKNEDLKKEQKNEVKP